MKPGKAPGPNGYTIQYYKTLLPILSPYMITFFNAASTDVSFPRDSLRAHISVIHKEGKDPTSCSSYRPISLLNVDLKFIQ